MADFARGEVCDQIKRYFSWNFEFIFTVVAPCLSSS